jgi:hypothetical protein
MPQLMAFTAIGIRFFLSGLAFTEPIFIFIDAFAISLYFDIEHYTPS